MSQEQAPSAPGGAPQLDQQTFTVLTWNVLAHAYARPKYYPGVPPEHLDPAARQALLLRRLAELEAGRGDRGGGVDIGCFQEVEAEVAGAILGAHPAHEGRWAQREGRRDGCLILWRRDRLALSEERVVRYREAEGGELALIVGLRACGAGEERGQTGPEIAVACTHLRWMAAETPPDRHTGVLQARELIAEMQACAAPIRLLCGDLNDTAQGPVLGEIYAAGWQESCRSQRPWDTVNINERRRKLDYALYQGPLSPEPLPLPALHRGYRMPSAVEPSDHLALSVRFRLVSPPP